MSRLWSIARSFCSATGVGLLFGAVCGSAATAAILFRLAGDAPIPAAGGPAAGIAHPVWVEPAEPDLDLLQSERAEAAAEGIDPALLNAPTIDPALLGRHSIWPRAHQLEDGGVE